VSPTARSLAHGRQLGMIGGVVERWNSHARVRHDFLGFADILFVVPGMPGVLAVQACTTGDQSKRVAKILAEPRARVWLEAKNRLQIIGWAKRGSRGQRKLWTPSITEVSLDAFRDRPA
jgi:hypothetical protein